MTTSINGNPATWPADIAALWQQLVGTIDDPTPVSSANFFTPRPYAHEYDRGSKDAGFIYTRGHEVYQVLVAPRPEWAALRNSGEF